ncbi:MAG: alpha/beta hydrolase family protein [Limisphaerales bacterium]
MAQGGFPDYACEQGGCPALLIHGDADMLVPIRQSKRIMGKFKQEGVEAELLTMPGKNHGWKAEPEEIKRFGDWFDKHLLRGE